MIRACSKMPYYAVFKLLLSFIKVYSIIKKMFLNYEIININKINRTLLNNK